MNNKEIFAKNLQHYMNEKGKSRKEVSEAIGVSYYTYTDWVKGKKYPRMNMVEKLANYFGILKSDLIEEKAPEHREMQKNNNAIADIVVKLRTDEDFLSVVNKIKELDSGKLKNLLAFLQ